MVFPKLRLPGEHIMPDPSNAERQFWRDRRFARLRVTLLAG
jgi:hypothetical protein